MCRVLHLAAAFQSERTLQYLLRAKGLESAGSLNTLDNFYRTALFSSVLENNFATAQLLLDFDIDRQARDFSGSFQSDIYFFDQI